MYIAHMPSALNRITFENRQTHSAGQHAHRCRVGRGGSVAFQAGAGPADVCAAVDRQRLHLADGAHHTPRTAE